MYTEARLEREIFDGLAKIEKEFAKIEEMIAAVYTLTGQHRNGHYVLVSRKEAAEMLGVCLRQFDRLAKKWAPEKVALPRDDGQQGPSRHGYRKSQIYECLAGREGTEDLQALRRRVLQRCLKITPK